MATDTRHRTPGETFAGYSQLVVITCGACGILFAMPESLQDKAIEDHDRWFWCPNGHKIHYFGDTAAQKLQKKLDNERIRAGHLAAARDQAVAERNAQKAVASRFKNQRDGERRKATAGVCPVPGCKRHFQQLDRHMKSQHPDFVVEHQHGGSQD
jgi:hypothetical protein